MRSSDIRPRPTATAARDGGTLTLSAALSGVAAYAFITIGTREYGAAAFAPVSVLWTCWVATSAALTFPIQHWIIKKTVDDGDEADIGALGRLLVRRTPLLAVVTAVVVWSLREQLFLSDRAVYPLAAAAMVPLSATLGFVRGVLGARTEFRTLGTSLVLENAVRVIALVTLLAIGAPVSWVPGALLAGFAIVVLWPSTMRIRATRRSPPPVSTIASLAGGQIAAQMLLAGPPVALALRGGSAVEVTSLFSAMALLRAPHMLLVGASPVITATLTRFTLGGSLRGVRWGLCGAGAATPLVALAVAPAVRWLLPTVFGDTVTLADTPAVLATGGGWAALLTLLALLVAHADGRGGVVGPAWATACVIGAVPLVVVNDRLVAVTAWLLTTELLALVLLILLGRHSNVGHQRSRS